MITYIYNSIEFSFEFFLQFNINKQSKNVWKSFDTVTLSRSIADPSPRLAKLDLDPDPCSDPEGNRRNANVCESGSYR